MSPSISVFALSWRSPATTERSLASWATLDPRVVTERYIWYQELASAQTAQAQRHGFIALGSDSNLGIGRAYQECVERCTSEFALFLECDWLLTGHAPEQHLRNAMALLAEGTADLVRLRSRRRPGWPLNTIVVRGREAENPHWLLESCYWMRRPDRRFAEEIHRVETGGDVWFLARSRNAAWTNNPHMARTSFLQGVADRSPKNDADFEPVVNAWWGDERIVVAQGRGLFTHSRVDGPSVNTSVTQRLLLDVKRALPAAAYRSLRRNGEGV